MQRQVPTVRHTLQGQGKPLPPTTVRLVAEKSRALPASDGTHCQPAPPPPQPERSGSAACGGTRMGQRGRGQGHIVSTFLLHQCALSSGTDACSSHANSQTDRERGSPNAGLSRSSPPYDGLHEQLLEHRTHVAGGPAVLQPRERAAGGSQMGRAGGGRVRPTAGRGN